MANFKLPDMNKEYSVTKTFRIKISLLEQMQALADKNNISLNRFAIECIEFAIKNLEDIKSEDKKKDHK